MEDSEKADSEPSPTVDNASTSQGKSCALCGCATPAVRCDRCNSQVFCLSCDDMYHRHPKRKLHLRKAVESIWTTARSPRLRRRTELPGDPCKIPIPPPRMKKRERHIIGGGRMFLKSGLELGSFGHSKVFDPKSLPTSKDFFTEQKSPASLVESNCDDMSNQNMRNEPGQIYENDNVVNPDGNLNDRSPWNATRPNISSPIQVSIPSSSPDIVANGQSFGYPTKPHSQSAADLTGHSGHPVGHHPYHFHPPYPYMHPSMHPSMHPYSHSMAHLNCAQCISSSWSNLMSPHPSPYFHPMPWGSAQNTMSRGHPIPGQPGPMKHSHGDLVSYPDSSFHYPYPGGGYYHNGPPVVDPNFIKDLHEQAEMQKIKKEATGSKPSPGYEDMDTTMSPVPVENEPSSALNEVTSTEAGASAARDVQEVDESPVVPEKPTEPWSCLHCTFINPPGSYICQVCCKTSYGNKHLKEEESEIRPLSRDSESPLVNRDALLNTPDMPGFKEAQKDDDMQFENQLSESEMRDRNIPSDISETSVKLTTETQTSTTTKTTDAQTQNIIFKSIASSTDSIFPKQETSVQTEVEAATQNCSVATDPMISSQSLESLLSGVSAPPYHNRRAGWGRGATSFSTQSLYERGRSHSPMPRSLSIEAHNLGRKSNFASEEAMHSASQAWLYTDPMYYKPHNQGLQPLTKEDYFDGTWGSMDKLNHRVKHKKDKGKLEHRPKFHRSLDDLKSEKRPEIVHTQELLMLQTVKEAERCGFSLEDLHVAYLNCGKENPVYWLEDNWSSMIKNVIALAAKYGEDNEENDVGVITTTEAKDALRIHRGDIWDAVTECIENRQRKILELTVRGNFTQKQIAEALKNNEGNVELAYADLVRASTRRHKFILSPGLSEDSEDLNLYNPTEDSALDHRVSLSPMKPAKTDVTAESKTEKKKSDFLTKLSTIRQAQSERRKAREEKELIRENITQNFPVSVESDTALKSSEMMSISREDSKEVEENIQDVALQSDVEAMVETESRTDSEVAVVTKHIKEGTEDNIPVDFDTNWSESQGEWIEEYSDEQWESDEHWVGLGKKFQKMEKEFEEEAMQMAALWEKEELEDDVFEEETKAQTEVEAIAESDKKFDEWVQANLKVDSSEYEEEEIKTKPLQDIPNISLRDRIDLEVSGPSPLQHYPTEHDLSFKSQFESEWVDLPADAEIEKLAHDIVCEGSDIENKFEESEIVSYEEEKKPIKFSDQGSDEDWEKIEMDEQLQDVNELDSFAFPDKEGEVDKNVEAFDESFLENQITIDKDSKVLYKNLEDMAITDVSNVEMPTIDSREQITDEITVSEIREKLPSDEGDQPRPPVRRKSKLNSAAIEQALQNQALSQISSDIPPALPEKMKHKDAQQKMVDIYALPDKTVKPSQEEEHFMSEEIEAISSPQVPQKPPRLNLSPLPLTESALQMSGEEEKGPEIPHKRLLSKDTSPLSLSFESDSNCFADSESDTEVKLHRQKNKYRKLTKYENESGDKETKTTARQQLNKLELEEKGDALESNFDFELDDDIDPALIEPLPRMKDPDFDPELPILLPGRGSRLSDLEDLNAPKAFREDTARPLQLFKAVKKETPTNTLSRTSPVTAEQFEEETSFISKATEEIPMPVSTPSSIVPDSTVYENQPAERYYYNEAISPDQNLNRTELLDKQETVDKQQTTESLVSSIEVEEKTEQIVQPVSPVQEQQDEMVFTEMEGLSAAVDYFFGRYDEIKVTHPKKKTMKIKPPATTVGKSDITDSKIMSTSEVSPVSKGEAPSQMEQSAAAVLQEQPQPEPATPIKDVETSLSNQEMQKMGNKATTEVSPPARRVKEPTPSEPLPFAEDYLFGCYNQVIVPTKTRNKPLVLATIPKLSELRAQKEHKPSTSTPVPSPTPTPEPPSELPSEEPVEQELEGDENMIPSDSTSMIYDEVFHDLPPEMLANQSFDEGSIYESSIYESFQDAVEEMQESCPITSSVVNVRPKSVHFEEPAAPVVPPRRNKTQVAQKAKAPTPVGVNESYADEYLFRQYEQVSQATQAKKKLPVCSQDFRMQQGFEPTQFPCDTPLMPGEKQKGVLSSETNAKIPPKSIDSSKYSSEYEFGNSEQPLDAIKYAYIKSEILDANRSFITCSEDDSVPVAITSDVQSPDVVENTDTQSSENAESFEVLSIPDQSEEFSENSLVSSDFNVIQEYKIVSEVLASSTTESQLNNMQSSQISDVKSYESSMTSDKLEMDQFVFIEQSQDIIDDTYNLYDIQESLACDLNYVDVKGNIEDECTDDSEKEWKRNEDRKNSLNASFLRSGLNKGVTEDEEKTTLVESEVSSLDESKDHLSSTDNLKTEESTIESKEEIKSLTGNLEFLESEHVEATFSVKSANVNVEKQNLTVEMLDSQLLTEVSEAAETVDTDLDITNSDTTHETRVSLLTENAEKISESEKAFLQVDQEIIESIDQEVIKSTDQEISELIKQEVYESVSKEAEELIDQEITKSVDQQVTESIEQEVIQSISHKVIETVDQEGTESIDETIEAVDQEGAESIDVDIAECVDQEIAEYVDQEVSECVDEEITESTDQEIAESTDKEVSESVNEEIAEYIIEPHPEICLEVSEKANVVSFISESSYLFSTEEDIVEKEAEIESGAVIAEDSDVSEDQQIDMLDEFEALGDLSDDNVSSHSSVSTQIAVSMKIGPKEIEGDESSLNFEQNENLENDGEMTITTFLPSDKLQVDDENNIEYSSEIEDFEKIEHISEMVASTDEDFEYESSNIDRKQYTVRSAELTPTPSFEEPQTVRSSELTPTPSFEETQLERYSPEVDSNESVANNVNLCTDMKEEADESVPEFLNTKTMLPEEITTDDSEVTINVPESSELDSESVMAEEISLPVMSHFYDDLYHTVQPSAQFTLLSTETIYAKYCTAESSESGSESDVDNALNNISEDVSQNLVHDITSQDQLTREDITIFDYESEELPSKKELTSEAKLHDVSDIYEKSEIGYTYVTEAVSQADSFRELSAESRLEFVQCDEVSERNAVEEAEIPTVQERTEAISVFEDSRESFQSVKDQERSSVKSVESKFSTSKSCQTEDSFEEDIFFDSFDDTFTIPSYIHLPIEAQDKHPTSDISVQCELISIEDIMLSQKLRSTTQTEATSLENQEVRTLKEPLEVPPDVPQFDEQQSKQPELLPEEKEESSCESFEDSDSDIFLESPSSHDELDVGAKKGYLYAELDSDTGFSSGSESGWTRKRYLKEKELKKSSKSLVEKAETEVHSLQMSIASSRKKEVSDSVQIEAEALSISEKAVPSEKSKIETEKEHSEVSSTVTSEKRETKTEKDYSEVSSTVTLEKSEAKTGKDYSEVSLTVTSEKSETKTEKDYSEVSPTMTSEKSETKSEKECSEVFTEEASVSSIPIEILERAVTPVAIPQYPSFEEDVIFVEIEETVEEAIDEKQVEITSTIPTVEYFYGPLPQSIKIEKPPDLNDGFYETASELSEPMSLTFDRTESFSDSISSIPNSEEQMFTALSIDMKETSEGLEDESLTDTFASLKNDIDESISEYYQLPDSATSLAARASLADSDIFDFAQSEISDISTKESLVDSSAVLSENEELLATQHLISDDKSKDSKLSPESLQSTINESLITSDTEDNMKHLGVLDISSKIHSETEVADKVASETLEDKQIVDLEPDLSAQEGFPSDSKFMDVSVPDSFGYEQIPSIPEPVIFDIKSDVPPVPSDIVRYLYYDDTITFDDDSYHTQSENPEIPSLSTEVTKPVDVPDENQNVHLISDTTEKTTSEVCIMPDSKTEKILQPVEVPATETVLKDEVIQRSAETAIQEVQELQTVPESSFPEDTLLEEDLKLADVKAISSVDEAPTAALDEPKLSISEDAHTTPVSDLKFPTVEVITSENVVDLPITSEQIHEHIAHTDRQIIEPVTIMNIPSEDISPLPEDIASENIVLRQVSPEVPSVPSDIVRYLYYGDDISFEEATQSSFHSQSESYMSGLPLEEIQPQSDSPKDSDIIATTPKPEFEQFDEIFPELKQDSSLFPAEESSYILDSSSARDESNLPFDSSECIDNWFDMEEDKSVNGKKEKQDSSSTKSSALKDSEQPCIPEYILSPKLEGDLPVGKIDIDEVTDISTHFTMTDDSDRFSDIESDTSLNFEEECNLPLEDSDQIEMGNVKDDRMFESCIEEEDDINLRTPEVKEIPEGFQFVPAEQLKELIISSVPRESVEYETFDECISSTEFSEQHSKEQFSECLTSSELRDQQEIMPECPEEDKEIFDVILSKLPDQELSREIVQEQAKEELKEIFDECITSTEFSELSKEQFAECLTSSQLHDQQSGVIAEECFEKEKLDIISSVLHDQEMSKETVHELVKEEFDECITSTELSDKSKEQFAECLTSSELHDQQSSKMITQEYFEEEKDKSDVITNKLSDQESDKESEQEQVKEEFDECITSTEFSEVSKEQYAECLTSSEFDQQSNEKAVLNEIKLEHPVKQLKEESLSDLQFQLEDENGNFPQLIIKETVSLDTISPAESDSHVSSDRLVEIPPTEITKSSINKNDEMDISCYTIAEEGGAESLHTVHGSDEVCTSEVLSSQSTTVKATEDNDLDVSTYVLPDDDSHSIFTEVTDKWSDAESRYIKADQSVYDMPLEDSDNLDNNILCTAEASKEESIAYEAKCSESIESNKIIAIESKESDCAVICDIQKKEVTAVDIKGVETVLSQDSDLNIVTEDIKDKFESEKSEISTADDSLHTVSEISDTKETSVYDDPELDIEETVDDKQWGTLTQMNAFEQASKTSAVSLLSSDVKNISEIKMETESEISTTLRKGVNIEFMSAASGTEPISSLEGTMYDTQEVQLVESKELCLDDKVITGVLAQSVPDSSEADSKTNATMERFQLADDTDIFESSPLDIIKIKDIGISKTETKDLYESDFIFSEVTKDDSTKVNGVSSVEKNDFISPSCDTVEVSELLQQKELYMAQSEAVDIIAGESNIEQAEFVDFKGEIDSSKEIIETRHDKLEISPNKSLDSKEQVDFKMDFETVDFIGRKTKTIEETSYDLSAHKEDQKPKTSEFSPISEDQKKNVSHGIDLTEIVDFKGCAIMHTDQTDTQMTVSSDIEKEKIFKQEKLTCISDSNIPSEAVDFRGKSVSSDNRAEDLLEIVDFKGCPMIDKDQTEIEKPECKTITKEKAESKIAHQEKIVFSSDSNISSEIVDFKGILTTGDNAANIEISNAGKEIGDEKKFGFETGHQSSDTVDFKGKIMNENISTESKSEKESVSFKDTSSVTRELHNVQDSAIKLMENQFEIVDFKGQLNTSFLTETKEEKVGKSIKKDEVVHQTGKADDTLYETVDFKGIISAVKQGIQEEISQDKKDTKKIEAQHEHYLEQSPESIEFKEIIFSSYPAVEEPVYEPDVIRISEDANQALYSDNIIYDEAYYGTGINEQYGYDTYEQPLPLEQQIYGYDTYEQQTYEYNTGDQVFESQEQAFHHQIMDVDTVNYSISGESSELYSCAETLSAPEDSSVPFYSLSDDLEDTVMSTSDEFTDVPSDIPSHLTESSDKWSDVEGDFSFEESEFDRDKTPTRTADESTDAHPKEKEEFQEAVFDKEDESKIVSESGKDVKETLKTLIVEAEDKNISLEETEKFEMVSETIPTEISKYPDEDKRDYLKTTDVITSDQLISTEKGFESVSMKTGQNIEKIVDKALVIDTEKNDISKAIELSNNFKDATELLDSQSKIKSGEESLKVECMKELDVSSDQELASTDSAVLLQSVDNTELSSTEKSGDISAVSTIEDYIDVSTYQNTTEASDKWSDVESEMEHMDMSSNVYISKEDKQITEIDSSSNVTDQIVSSDAVDLSVSNIEDIQVERCDTESPLLEHFADIKSIKDQLTTVDTFSSFDAETAVSRTHEDTSTDISSQFEKTESEHWLEAETEHSISEFDEDVVFSSERDVQLEICDNEMILEEMVAAIPSSQLYLTETATTTSTSSSYTDLENSDQTSDTCADISLQGATTENSDKWSDIEAEALIDDVLYGNVDVTENVEVLDFPQQIRKAEENVEVAESSLFDSQLKVIQSNIDTAAEIGALSKLEAKNKNEIEEIKVSTESKYEILTSKSYSSFEGADTTSSVNLTDSGQSSFPTESSSLLSTPSNLTAAGMSDDELTNVTPLDVEESDKYSDISGDTSLEEIDEDSSVSLKADINLQVQETNTVSDGFKVGIVSKQESLIEESQKFDMTVTDSETGSSVKESLTVSLEDGEKEHKLCVQDKQLIEAEVKIIESSQSVENYASLPEQVGADTTPFKYSMELESKTEIGQAKESEMFEFKDACIEEKVEIEDSSSSKVTEESETADNYTDVPTHTLTSETSDAYCELESDHSFEEFESQHVELGDAGIQDIQQTTQNISESYENSFGNEEFLENADDFVLDSVPENELETFEDEEYSLSEHFEINEDELIYPLPYNDWIEQSFELKEYGIEAAFSESGSDIHGLGIACEEYDDEDIQRAIDYNLSTFEENEETAENVGTTDSFKTLSNDASPHVRPSEKEFDTWSTADAPSIEEEFMEQDSVLSKIDELLAEDFGDLDYAESPLKDDEDIEDYLRKDICTPDEIDFTQTDSSKIADSEIVSNVLMAVKDSSASIQSDKDLMVSESETGEIALKKDSKELKSSPSEESVLILESAKRIAGETKTSEVSSNLLASVKEPKTVPEISAERKELKHEVEKCLSASDENIQPIKQVSIVETETSLKLKSQVKSSKDFLSKSEDASASVTLSSRDATQISTDSAALSVSDTAQSIAVKQEQVSSVEAETTLKLESHVKSSKDFLSTSKDAATSVTLSSSESKQISTDSAALCVSDTAQSNAVKEKQISTEAETSLKLESHVKSSKDFLSTSEDTSASLTLSSRDYKQIKDQSTDSTALSISDTIQAVDVKDKQISSVKAEPSAKIERHIESSEDFVSTSEDASASDILSATDKSKQIKDQSVASTPLSVSETTKPISAKDKQISSVEAEASIKLESQIKHSKDFLSASEDASASVTLSSSDSDKQIKDQSADSATLSVSDISQSTIVKHKQSDSVEAEVSAKVESHVESTKDFVSTSEDASASVRLLSSDSDKKIKDQSSDSVTLSVSETYPSSDIPSKQLSKSSEASKEISTKTETQLEALEGTELLQSSQQLSESLEHSAVTAAEHIEVQSNIPDQQVCKDETHVESLSSTHVITSKEELAADSHVVEVKPDIPKKTRQRSLDSKEGTPLKDEKPSLPPKQSKRHSLSNSPSSSFGESLSSSSSLESLGSFESAPAERSRKSSLKLSDETSMHSLSPDVPARRSRSSKLSSSSRSTSKDSDSSSAPSRSSSLKIRRRSSNFRDIEPIDLSKKRASIDERIQKLQNEGKCTTKEKAFIAAKLIEMQFEEEDALLASRQCNTVYHAVKFLTQLCEMCNCRFPINMMSSMMHCAHRACKECLKAHFTSLIYDRSVFTLLCPVCHKPDITDQNIQEYFNNLDMMLRNFLDDRVYDLFQRKLRDEVLTKDPNFHWCSQCSSGFYASPRLKKLYCPDCSAITCALCHQTWELEHEGVHCERFQQWKDMHTPEPPPAGLVKFLIDRGVSCPSCGLVYAQACAGCMMYKCSHCSFEFCGFCIRPCKRGRDCSDPSCETRGLHIHHVQNCLFFLRDKDITEIQMLLEEESVTYLTIPPKDQIVKSRCQVREQKSIHGILSEDRCGRAIEPYCGGLCSTHYYEYLTELLRKNNISPLSIMTIQDLQFMLRKSRVLVPERVKGETSEEYYERLLNIVSTTLT